MNMRRYGVRHERTVVMTYRLYRRQGAAFRALFHVDMRSGSFAVDFPDLPGCVADGGDFVQARDFAKRALDAWIDAALERGEVVVPPASCHGETRSANNAVWITCRSGFDRARVR